MACRMLGVGDGGLGNEVGNDMYVRQGASWVGAYPLFE